MRDMLTETRNKHFSERLFYADSLSLLPQSVAPCSNGNIAAARISQSDSIYTFAYSYDPLNRLTSSVRMTDAGTSPSEQFSYDASGNIIFLTRYNGRQKIDSLVCRYKNDGHQLVTVTDEGNDDDTYEVIEYHTEDMLADTSMWYDANGNLVYDEDRGISVIHYNVLNLPDTVQFINGNQIVNLYDAAGRKYKSITYIVPETAIIPRYEIMQYGFDVDTIDYLVTEYAGTIENHYSRIDTTRRIHNATGYYTNNAYYHYIKDHLGNICAVVHSTADTLIQGTIYYASGIPMAYSFGRDQQPYLYNSKEFVEAHGYNTYDYGFRGYYATIGRFTTIDPLAEQTPWQSPYAYAGNNFINNIDWMGLDAITISGQAAQDFFSYLVGGGDWKTYDYRGWDDVTDEWEHGFFDEYGRDWYYYSVTAGPGGGGNWGGNIAEVTVARVVNASKYIDFCKSVGEYALKLGEQGTEAVSFGINAWMADQWNPFGWEGAKGQYYDRSFLHKRGGYANSFKRAGERVLNSRWGKLGTKLGYVSIGLSGMDMLVNGPSVKSGIDIGIAGLGIIATSIAAPELILFCTIYGFTDIGVTWATGNSISGWIDYGVHQGINYFTEE